MTEESLGAAHLDIEVDVSQLEAAIRTAKNRLADMSTDAQKQYSQLNTAEKRRVDALISQADTLALTRAQQLAYNAALKTSGPVLDEITRKIAENEARLKASATQFKENEARLKASATQFKENEARLKASATQFNAYGLSAKQTAQALRQVPAQVTDIFVGLASGQRPLMVLLQQGGQLKDVFGGIVPAAKALGGALLGLVNPYTVAAAAAGGLLYVYNEGQKEAFEFQKAIILSGNAAGVTSGQLALAAARIDDFAGTQRNASKVLAQIASTGRVASGELEEAAKAAIRLQRVAGVSIEETIKNLVAIGEKPTEASRKLNLQYGYLNASTLARIKLLEDEGRTADAAAMAQRAFSDAGLQRADELEKHLGTLPRLAKDAGDAFKEMWDGLLGLGREETPEERLKEINAQIVILAGRTQGPRGGFLQSQLRALQAEQLALQRLVFDRDAAAKADGAKAAAVRAAEQWDAIAERNLSKREQLEREILKIRNLGIAAGKSEAEIQKQITAAREKAAGTRQAKVNADDNSAKSLVESIERQVEANKQLAETGEKVTASERLGITARQMLADTTNKMSFATRVYLVSMLPMLDASDAAAKAAVNEAKAKEALARQNAILEQQQINRRQGNEVDLAGIGRGDDEQAQMHRRIEISREYEAELRRIGDRSVADDKAVWDQLADNAKNARDKMLGEEEAFQRARAAAMADPLNGARKAWEDYLHSANDVASQTEALFSDAFGGAEDALVKFITTGKLSFKDLANSIISDLARIAAKKLISGVVGSVLGGLKLNADGNVYGSPGLSAFSGQVVSQPTLFTFAHGAGVMGEAGAEAIMPLKRTQGGKLGVMASGISPEVTVNVYGAPSNPETRTRRNANGGVDVDVLFRAIDNRVAENLSRGGIIAAALKSRFAVRERY